MVFPERSLQLDDFDYDLPAKFIAQEPTLIRDQCKLLILNRITGEIIHNKFFNLPHYISSGDVLVLNDARVMPYRIYGKTENNKYVEALLIKEIDSKRWSALIKPSKKIKEGIKVLWEDSIVSLVEKRETKGNWIILFESENIQEALNKLGNAPLPPYIKRTRFHPMRKADRIMYQTVFSATDGAIAAPTASLHFTERLLSELKQRGIIVCFITLLVGKGSFEPVRTMDITEHQMESEMFEIKESVAKIINNAKSSGKKVVACGTTVVRALETSALKTGYVTPCSGYTSLFIHPGFQFKVIDTLITNFHLPRSTPLILTSAFAGRDRLLNAYEEAKKHNYRFLSYGDAMMIV
jgi:S-adenosylmethionine:tRNA ribosyltransferase-isomerase